MNRLFQAPLVLGICLLGVMLGCAGDIPPAKKAPLGPNVWLEVEGEQRRVLIQAYVCLRMGQLEQLLTRKQTKEHESILAADIDAQHVHGSLLAAGAERGSPVKFDPKFSPPTGTTIKVTLEYKDPKTEKTVRVPAQQWIRSLVNKKDLQYDWVFAGSVDIKDPLEPNKKPFYGANEGDVICVSNFDTALLDLPTNSSKGNDDLAFEAHSERIPPVGTPVLVILEPVRKKKQ